MAIRKTMGEMLGETPGLECGPADETLICGGWRMAKDGTAAERLGMTPGEMAGWQEFLLGGDLPEIEPDPGGAEMAPTKDLRSDPEPIGGVFTTSTRTEIMEEGDRWDRRLKRIDRLLAVLMVAGVGYVAYAIFRLVFG